MANGTQTLDLTPDSKDVKLPPETAEVRSPQNAATPQQKQSERPKWDAVGELKKRYPGIANETDQKILQHLSKPNNFRSAFPEYKHLDDKTIQNNINLE